MLFSILWTKLWYFVAVGRNLQKYKKIIYMESFDRWLFRCENTCQVINWINKSASLVFVYHRKNRISYYSLRFEAKFVDGAWISNGKVIFFQEIYNIFSYGECIEEMVYATLFFILVAVSLSHTLNKSILTIWMHEFFNFYSFLREIRTKTE